MDALRLTEVPREQLPEQPKRFNNALFFANKDRVSRLCMVALIVSLVCNGLQIVTLLVLLNRKDSVTIVDEDGGIKVGSSKSLADAKEFHQRLAFQATEALFLRNPRDFDEPELLQGLFSRPALNRASALKAVESRTFEELQMQQKPLIARIDIRQSGPGEFRAQVSGELSRSGVVDNKAFSDAVVFTLELTMRRNPDLLRSKLQPLKIWDFNLTYETRTN